MTDWFDPQTWLRQIPDPLNVRGLIQDGTETWLNEMARLAQDRPMEIRQGDTRVLGTVRSVQVYPRSSPGSLLSGDAGFDALERAVVVADQITWNGRLIDRAEIVVEDVRVAQLPTRRIRGGPVTIHLNVPISTVATWLRTVNITMVDAPHDATMTASDGCFWVRYEWRRVTFDAAVAPAATSGQGVFTIHELRLRGRKVPLPKRFNMSLSVPVALGDGIRLRDASLVDPATVAVEVQARSVDYPISIPQILERLGSPAARSVLEVGR